MMHPPLRWLIGGAAAAAVLGAIASAPALRPAARAEAEAADTAITSRSIAYFERRLAAQPDNYMVESRLIGRYLLRFGTGADAADLARAESLARDLVRTAPDRGPALSRLSGVLLMQHNFADALSVAREALALDSLDQDALGAWFDAALAAGRYGEADTALARMRPRALGTQVRRGQWLDASGRTEAAFDTFDRICRQLARSGQRPPVVAWCLTELAGIEHGRRGPEAAAAIWGRALEVQPGYRGAVEGLADLAQAQGAWSRAGKLYRQIATDAHPDLYLRAAESAAARGDSAEARRYQQRFLAVANRPENEALFGEVLALYFAERAAPGARDTALALALRDVARRPTVESYDVLSWVRYRRGELDQALAASDSARRWGSPSPTMDYHRARILLALGRETEGTRLMLSAQADPTLLAPHARQGGQAALSAPTTTWSRAARQAGKNPPINPMTSANSTPATSSPGVTRKANATSLNDAQFVVPVTIPVDGEREQPSQHPSQQRDRGRLGEERRQHTPGREAHREQHGDLGRARRHGRVHRVDGADWSRPDSIVDWLA